MRFAAPLASITLSTALFSRDISQFPKTPTASFVSPLAIMKKNVVAMTLCESAPLMPTESTMKPRIMMAMVTAVAPPEEVLLAVAAVVG